VSDVDDPHLYRGYRNNPHEIEARRAVEETRE
jgi:hypothetical protein